jgi:hypothetical protein
MMPEAYRLNMNTMAVIMDSYAKYVVFLSLLVFHPLITRYSQLADHYGADIAGDILKRTMPTTTSNKPRVSPRESLKSNKPYQFKSNAHAGQPIYRAF